MKLSHVIIEKSFGEVFPKNKWVVLDKANLDKDPEIAKEILTLVNKAYSEIGGNIGIKTLADLKDVQLYIKAIDIDKDDEADAALIAKKKPKGKKLIAMGHDGSSAAKRVMVNKAVDDIKKNKFYVEASHKVAVILVKKMGLKPIDNQKKVESVLGKSVEWEGDNPKYPGIHGWYNRKIGGQTISKVLIGNV